MNSFKLCKVFIQLEKYKVRPKIVKSNEMVQQPCLNSFFKNSFLLIVQIDSSNRNTTQIYYNNKQWHCLGRIGKKDGFIMFKEKYIYLQELRATKKNLTK